MYLVVRIGIQYRLRPWLDVAADAGTQFFHAKLLSNSDLSTTFIKLNPELAALLRNTQFLAHYSWQRGLPLARNGKRFINTHYYNKRHYYSQ